MNDIRDILRLRFARDLTRDEIAASVGVSAGTVSNVLKRASEAGLAAWPLPDGLDGEALRDRLYPQAERSGSQAQPDWDAIVAAYRAPRGRRRVGMTRRQLWRTYRDEVRLQGGEAYGYSRFCTLLNRRLGGPNARTEMRFDYEPGLYGMADFSGKTLALQTNTGPVDVEIFVAVLAHSSLIYAEAVPNQKVRHWTQAHRRALEYFGGAPERWVIDNLKSGVTKADREHPKLNPTFRDFAEHYDLAVIPAESNSPRHKASVEASVRAVQTGILLPLQDVPFFSVETMNVAIHAELEKLNDQPMSKGVVRREVFEAGERAALQPLPDHPWEWSEWLTRKVAPNGHVSVDRNHYSVPEGNIGRSVDVRVGERMLEVFAGKGGNRIAVHHLKPGRNAYSTLPEHMPDRLKAVKDIRRPDYGDMLLRQAAGIGENALAWAQRCFASRDFPEQAFTTVRGMCSLAGKHGADAVNAVCAEALDRDRLGSGFLSHRLRNGGRAAPPRPEPGETIPDHPNLRGGSYYSNNGGETS